MKNIKNKKSIKKSELLSKAVLLQLKGGMATAPSWSRNCQGEKMAKRMAVKIAKKA